MSLAVYQITFVTLCRLPQPIFLGWLVSLYNEDVSDDDYSGYIYGTLVVLCSLFSVWTMHLFWLNILHLGMKIRVATCSLIYRKVIPSSFFVVYLFVERDKSLMSSSESSVIKAKSSCSSRHHTRSNGQPAIK